MPAAGALDRNLARLRRRAPALADAVAAAGTDGIEVLEGPRGARSLSEAGVQLASRYDPRAEGERLADAMCQEPAHLHVVMGFALGHHIQALLSRTGRTVIVYEPSPERLRAALDLDDELPWLAAPELHLCTSEDALRAAFIAEYVPGVQVRVHPHPTIQRIAGEAVGNAVRAIARAKESMDVVAATRVQMNDRWAEITAQNLPHLLSCPSLDCLRDRFRGVTAVVAAAGPSLDRQLPTLREERERILLIAIGQSLGALRAAGIEPDLVHVVESQDVSHQFTDVGGAADANLAILASVHPSLYELPARSRFVIYPKPNDMAVWIAEALGCETHAVVGGTVAQSAVYLAHYLGAEPVLVIGQDLAFTGGRMYASGSSYADVGFRQTKDNEFIYTNRQRKLALFGLDADQTDEEQTADLIWVEGWDGERVPTNVAYATFIEQYRDIGRDIAGAGGRLVNCTEGGARLPGIEHMSFREGLALQRETRPVPRDFAALAAASKPFAVEPVLEKRESSLRALESLEREVRDGLRAVERAERGIAPRTSAERVIDLLRRVGRSEKKVRRRLERLTWLDAVLQPEIHRFAARTRAAELPEDSPRRALAEARELFTSTQAGIERGRALFARMADTLADVSDRPLDASGGA